MTAEIQFTEKASQLCKDIWNEPSNYELTRELKQELIKDEIIPSTADLNYLKSNEPLMKSLLLYISLGLRLRRSKIDI